MDNIDARAATAIVNAGAEPAVSEFTSTERPQEQKQPEAAVDALKQGHYVEGGKPQVEIIIDEKLQIKAADMLEQRFAQIARIGEKRPLTEIEKIIAARGVDTIARLRLGQLNTTDYALIWMNARDELLQKALGSGKRIETSDGYTKSEWKKIIGIPIGKKSVAYGPETKIVQSDHVMSTPYLEETGFDDLNDESVINNLIELDRLRVDMELALFGQSFDDPLYKEFTTSVYPTEALSMNRNTLNQAVVENMKQILKDRYGSQTHQELMSNNPAEALKVVYEAQQHGLATFSDGIAKSLLESDNPQVSADVIREHATKLKEKPKEEELKPLEYTLAETRTAYEQVSTRINMLTQQLTERRNILDTRLEENGVAENAFKATDTLLEAKVQAASKFYDSIDSETLPDHSKEKNPAAKDELWRKDKAARLEKAQGSYLSESSKREKLALDRANAASRLVALQDSIARLEKEEKQAKREKNSRYRATLKAEAALKSKKEEIDKGSPEKAKKAAALETWAKLADSGKFGELIDSRLKQKYGTEYSIQSLASIAEHNGQIEGAERIREGLFYLIDKVNYNAESAREMVSNETIARALIAHFNINQSERPLGGGNPTLREYMDEILTIKKSGETDPAIIEADNARRVLYENTLLTYLLPHLERSSFKTSDFIGFLAKKGLRSAERGNPYLEIPDSTFKEPTQELKIDARTFLRKDVGVASIRDKKLIWDGKIEDSAYNMIPGARERDLTFHYEEDVDREHADVSYLIQVKVDMQLRNSLPSTINPSLPIEIRKAFYDKNGNLRTELSKKESLRAWRADGKIPEYITLRRGDVKDLDIDAASDWLWRITDNLAADHKIDIAIANSLLNMIPSERLAYIKGIKAPFSIPNIPVAGRGLIATVDGQFSIDNSGNFYFTEAGDTITLERYFDLRHAELKKTRNVTELSETDAEALQKEFQHIQEYIGRQIRRGQERR